MLFTFNKFERPKLVNFELFIALDTALTTSERPKLVHFLAVKNKTRFSFEKSYFQSRRFFWSNTFFKFYKHDVLWA